MATSKKPAKSQVALRKGPTDAGIIAELVTLLETVTADGTITDVEAVELRTWLDENRNSDLPAIDFLRTLLDQILADGRVTAEERKALHMAIERVLPAELRDKAKGRRIATELINKAREREEKTALRLGKAEEREKNRRIYSANFMVAGILYEGRSEIVERHLQTGQRVFLARDPLNPFDDNAIQVRLQQGYQIGFVPREDARELAPLLDAGYKQSAHCTKILNGRRAPIPVVQADLFRADAMVDGAISSSEVPPRSPLPAAATTVGCRTVFIIAAVLLIVVLAALVSC